jgi:hypothetical protein
MAITLSTGAKQKILGDASGGSFKTLFTDGVIEIYSGTKPTDADATENGTKLVRITVDGDAFTAGSSANGLEFANAVATEIEKAAAETWTGTAVASGTAGWFRFYANAYGTGASTSAVRFDGRCGTSNADMVLSTLSVVSGYPVTVNTFKVTLT